MAAQTQRSIPAWWHNPQVRRGSWLLLAALLVSLLGPWLAPHAPAEMVGPVYGMPQGWLSLAMIFSAMTCCRACWPGAGPYSGCPLPRQRWL